MLCVRPLRSLTIASSMLVWLGVATLYFQETRTKTVIFAGDLIDGSSDDPRGPQTPRVSSPGAPPPPDGAEVIDLSDYTVLARPDGHARPPARPK